MLNIKRYKYINKSIEEYFNTNLFDIKQFDMKNKKLFIVSNNKKIIGSFFINVKFNTLETLYIVKEERGKGNCTKIINYLKKNYLTNKGKNFFLYFDTEEKNTNAVNCYKKHLKYIGILSHEIFFKIYNFRPKKDVILLRYALIN
jgi:hypothetical protein